MDVPIVPIIENDIQKRNHPSKESLTLNLKVILRQLDTRGTLRVVGKFAGNIPVSDELVLRNQFQHDKSFETSLELVSDAQCPSDLFVLGLLSALAQAESFEELQQVLSKLPANCADEFRWFVLEKILDRLETGGIYEEWKALSGYSVPGYLQKRSNLGRYTAFLAELSDRDEILSQFHEWVAHYPHLQEDLLDRTLDHLSFHSVCDLYAAVEKGGVAEQKIFEHALLLVINFQEGQYLFDVVCENTRRACLVIEKIHALEQASK